MFGRRIFGRGADDQAAPAQDAEQRSTLLEEALAVLEAEALAIYREHELPDRPGQYSRSPGSAGWTWLAESLSPEQKWALVEQQPPGDGWRYSDLSGIGANSSTPQVDVASQVLTGCAALRDRLRQGARFDADEVAAAIQLGALAALITTPPEPVRSARKRAIPSPDLWSE